MPSKYPTKRDVATKALNAGRLVCSAVVAVCTEIAPTVQVKVRTLPGWECENTTFCIYIFFLVEASMYECE